jgi:hypothetical protein
MRRAISRWREGGMFQGALRREYYARRAALESLSKRRELTAAVEVTKTTVQTARLSDERKSDDEYYKKRVQEQERQSAEAHRNFAASMIFWHGPG